VNAIFSSCGRIISRSCKAAIVLAAVCAFARSAYAQTVSVTLQSEPSGLLVALTFGGNTWSQPTPHVVTGLIPGETAFLSAPAQQQIEPGIRWILTALPPSIVIPASNSVVTAIFTPQFQLSVAAGRGGNVTPMSGEFFDPGSVVNVNATPSANYTFSAWVGPVANPASSATTVTMDSPKTVTATFTSTSPILNIDNSGEADQSKYGAATDGILLIRYLLGFRGDTLVNGALGSGPALRDAAQIEQHIQTRLSFFDVDGDGLALPHSDGLMVLRRLSAPNANPADTVAASAITANAKRTARGDELVVRAIDLMRP
jgi:Divergent InlB B-repeat domain